MSQCYAALEAEGFTRHRVNSIDWPLGSGFHCWVGLNKAPDENTFEINPFVGIHVVQIEELWTIMKARDYRRSSATYAIHMGEIVPDERAFIFTPTSNVEAEAKRLAHLYATVGLNYAKSIASYQALLPLLEERVEMLGAYPERVACCLYLMGRVREAEEFTIKFCDREPEYFGHFAESFLAYVRRGE